jgi:protoporphyrinogen oxidase
MPDRDVNIAILGAGLSGLSTSYHLGHAEGAVIFEAKQHHGGHVHSEQRDGFTWDDGPHISFTSNEYVKQFFAESVDGEYEELDIKAVNYFRGRWIDHPAQTSLWQVPEPLRTQCVQSFLDTVGREHAPPRNYEEWLHQAMGPTFADTFPAAYTRKYWTTDPASMDIDWIGLRVLRPEVDDVVNGAKGPLPGSMYYVNTRSARYPSRGGFWSYCHRLADGADIRYGMRVDRVDLDRRALHFEDGTEVTYRHLVSSIPLPALVAGAVEAPAEVRDAVSMLRSTHFYRIDVAVSHPPRREELWYYVYDEDKLSVRISVTERFAPSNAPAGRTGIQVEVYGSAFKPLPSDPEAVKVRVVDELVEMGLVDQPGAVESAHATFVPTGQILYDLNRREALRAVNRFLDRQGVVRVGRYAEWKYLMTDACLLGGRRAARHLLGSDDDTDWAGVAITDDDVPEPELDLDDARDRAGR